MIKTQIIKEGKKPIAVLMDYDHYQKLKEIEQDKVDYNKALRIKKTNKKWKAHTELKEELGIS